MCEREEKRTFELVKLSYTYCCSQKRVERATQRTSCLKSEHFIHKWRGMQVERTQIDSLRTHSVIIRPSWGSKAKKLIKTFSKIKLIWKKIKIKSFKVANEVETKLPVVDQLDKSAVKKSNMKMTPVASPPPAIPSWAPMLFPPWNLPAAFYPAALRSLPK